MDQLKETEDMIAQYRQLYNDMVYVYNNKCEMFPSNINTNYFNFQEAEFFEPNEKAINILDVDFNTGIFYI